MMSLLIYVDTRLQIERVQPPFKPPESVTESWPFVTIPEIVVRSRLRFIVEIKFVGKVALIKLRMLGDIVLLCSSLFLNLWEPVPKLIDALALELK